MIDTYIVIPKLYGIVSKAIETRDSQFRANVAKFVNDRHEQLFDIAPYDRIYFNQKDIDLMFKSLNLDEKEILNIIQNTCYYTESGYNPPCAREPYVMVLLMIIRYYLKTNKRQRNHENAKWVFVGTFLLPQPEGIATRSALWLLFMLERHFLQHHLHQIELLWTMLLITCLQKNLI